MAKVLLINPLVRQEDDPKHVPMGMAQLAAIALRELHALAIKQFVCPGDPTWPLGTLFPQPANKAEGGQTASIIYLPNYCCRN